MGKAGGSEDPKVDSSAGGLSGERFLGQRGDVVNAWGSNRRPLAGGRRCRKGRWKDSAFPMEERA